MAFLKPAPYPNPPEPLGQLKKFSIEFPVVKTVLPNFVLLPLIGLLERLSTVSLSVLISSSNFFPPEGYWPSF